jgi:hypothetical protein
MSEFGGRADVQLIRVNVLVMITVLPEPRPTAVIPGIQMDFRFAATVAVQATGSVLTLSANN